MLFKNKNKGYHSDKKQKQSGDHYRKLESR